MPPRKALWDTGSLPPVNTPCLVQLISGLSTLQTFEKLVWVDGGFSGGSDSKEFAFIVDTWVGPLVPWRR